MVDRRDELTGQLARAEAERSGLADEVEAGDGRLELPREARRALDTADFAREVGRQEGQPRDVGDVSGAADDVIDGEIALASVALPQLEPKARAILARARYLDVAENRNLSLDPLADPPGAPRAEVVPGQADALGVGRDDPATGATLPIPDDARWND